MQPKLKRIHYYTLISFFRYFFFIFFIALFFLYLQFLYRHLDELVGKGVELKVIAEMIFYVSAALLPFNFPLTILLASVMTFGTLGENNELLAMKAAGISLRRIINPLFLVVLFMCILSFFVANNLLPETNKRYMSILTALKEQRPELILNDGVFTSEIDGFCIKVGHIDRRNNEMYDILVYNHLENSSNKNVTTAKHGFIEMTQDKKFMILTLYDGLVYTDGNDLFKHSDSKLFIHQQSRFDKQVIRVRVYDFAFERMGDQVFANHHRMLNITELEIAQDSLELEFMNDFNGYISGFNLNGSLDKKITAEGARKNYRRQSRSFYVDFQSVLSNLSQKDKFSVLQVAQKNARNNLQNVLQVKSGLFKSQKDIRKYEVEQHRKFSLSLAIFIFFMIGSSFGAVVRKAGFSLPVVFCIVLLILYFIIGITGERLALLGVLPVYQGAWLTFMLLLPMAVIFTYLAVNDTMIMMSDSYIRFLDKIKKRFNIGS